MSKIDLKAFSPEALATIMAIRPSLMTKEQVQVYKKVKLENWLAKKVGKPVPWNFPSAGKLVEQIQDIDLSTLTENMPFQAPELPKTVPVSTLFDDKISSWQKIPDTIDVQELLGRTITCKLDGTQQICHIVQNDKSEVFIRSEKGIKCSVDLPHLYQAWKYATVLVNPPRISESPE